MSAPFALFLRGSKGVIFDLADALGFENEMEALAVSIFEDGPDAMYVQALFETQKGADDCLNGLTVPASVESFISQLPDEDWVSLSQQGLPPVAAGRFWIYGAHDAGKIPKGTPYPIKIEAGLAFGTGHHGTTKGCLLIFDQMLDEGFAPARVLDLGCGAGTLAIAAAMALDRPILATDIDQDAVDVTLENARTNGVASHIRALRSDGFNDPALQGQKFDLIFANILAGPLIGLAPDIATALAPNGRVILSGIIDDMAGKVIAAFEAEGLTVSPSPSIEGWTSLRGHKKSPA